MCDHATPSMMSVSNNESAPTATQSCPVHAPQRRLSGRIRFGTFHTSTATTASPAARCALVCHACSGSAATNA